MNDFRDCKNHTNSHVTVRECCGDIILSHNLFGEAVLSPAADERVQRQQERFSLVDGSSSDMDEFDLLHHHCLLLHFRLRPSGQDQGSNHTGNVSL